MQKHPSTEKSDAPATQVWICKKCGRGYAYEIVGTDGAIRFDQEDQNALWLYRRDDDEWKRVDARRPPDAGATWATDGLALRTPMPMVRGVSA